MLMDLESAIMHVSLHVVSKVEHILRFHGDVKVLRQVEVIPYARLYGCAPTLKTVIAVAVLCHVGIVEAVAHHDVGFHDLLEPVLFQRIVHDRPTDVRILSIAQSAEVGIHPIGKPLGVHLLVELKPELTSDPCSHLAPTSVVESADGASHA